MATNDPSLARRILPALALTGAGLGLVNVLDQPASTSAFGAADQAGIGGDGTSNGDGATRCWQHGSWSHNRSAAAINECG